MNETYALNNLDIWRKMKIRSYLCKFNLIIFRFDNKTMGMKCVNL